MENKKRLFLLLVFLSGIHFLHAQQKFDAQTISLDSLLNITVSTASKYEQKTSEAPSSVTIITFEDIKRFGYQTLDEILSSVRGFYINNDRTYSYLGVRGFGRPTDYNNRIQLLLNGCTLNDNIYFSSLLGTELGISLEAIERIEIVRGPGSVIYGAGAMLTVINLITKSAVLEEGARAVFKAGNFGKKQADFTWGKEFKNQLGVFVSGLWGDIKGEDIYCKEYDSPETNHGVAHNLDWDKYYGTLVKLTYKDFIFQSLYTQREKGIPTASWETVFNDPATRILDSRHLIELSYRKKISYNKTISARTYFNRYVTEETYPFDIHYYDNADGRWFGCEVQYLWDIISNFRFTSGLEYQNFYKAEYTYNTDYSTIFTGDFPQQITAIYAQSQYQALHNLSFTLGARWEDYTTTGSFITPRTGIIYNPFIKSAIKLLYGKAYRMPDVYEKHYVEAEYQKINPSLQQEQITTTELVYEQRIGHNIYGILSFFDYTMKDLIEWSFDTNDSLYWYRNLGVTKARGVEMEFNLRYDTGYLWYVNASWQKARVVNSDSHISNSPVFLINSGIAGPVTSYLNASLEVMYESKRYTVYNTTSEPYFLTNFYSSSNILFKRLKFTLSARNLFNVDYALPGGLEHIQPLIPQKGRSITFGTEIKF